MSISGIVSNQDFSHASDFCGGFSHCANTLPSNQQVNIMPYVDSL